LSWHPRIPCYYVGARAYLVMVHNMLDV